MEAAASSTVGGQGRRTNPSRSKRGGPGVGTCDVDLMILESYKRKLESEPLIPEDTLFMLTTNSSKFSGNMNSNGDSTISVNTVANDRYFDRPEVLKAFREQEIIQTPEFWAISESSSVGGRFRPRGAEDESAETSDAAYEKRHKKFETFEKRQRHREKEKLKHEHYKLKERIDQLRATDSSAFMAVPASAFLAPPPQAPLATDVETADPDALHTNGVAESAEGERRKREMLEHAINLEKRYSYLLPSERLRKNQDSSMFERVHDEEESETERIPQAGPSKKETESIKFRIPARSSLSTTPASSPAATKPPKKGKTQLRQSSRTVQSNLSTSVPPPDQTPSVSSPIIDIEMQTPEPGRPLTPPPPPPPQLALPPLTIIQVHAPLTTRPPSAPTPSRQTNGKARPQKDESAPQPPVVEPQEVKTPFARKTPRMRPIPVQLADDGESEKAPSDEEDTVKNTIEEVSGETEDHEDIPVPISNVRMQGPDEVLPEVREIATRLEQTRFVGTPPTTEREPVPVEPVHNEQPSFSEPEPIIPEVPEESVSTRPAKRQKKMSTKLLAATAQSQAQHTPSVPPSPRTESPAISTRPYRKKFVGPRGQQSQAYKSSITGEEIWTTSFLMMAAIRNEGAKRNVEKRHNTSFGIPTPMFKDLHDFEIPEWMHYPEDEEPAIPIRDSDIQYTQPEPQPVPSTETKQDHGDAQMESDNVEHDAQMQVEPISSGKLPSASAEKVAAAKDPEQREPSPSPTVSPQAKTTESAQPEETPEVEDERMEEEEEEPEDEGKEESPNLTEPESEPGVRVRVLSNPRDDEDEEQLLW